MATGKKSAPAASTRADVARRAGVSVATVSYVLNNSVKLPEDTRQRVMKAARELDYRPNHVARSLATNKTMQLAIVLNNISNPIYSDLILGFENAAITRGYFVTICTGSRNVDDYFTNFAARGMDGLFVEVLPDKYHQERLVGVLDAGIPVVTFGDPGIGSERISIVENDYRDAMAQAVDHLVELGHTEIGYVSGLARSQRTDGRIAAFAASLRRHPAASRGVNVAPRTTTPTGIDDGERLAAEALTRYPHLTALICTNDLMAIGALRAAAAAGRRVPEDLSIVGIDNAWVGELCSPALTTLAADYADTGAKAFELLYADITTGERSRVQRPLHLLTRGSTGPVARRPG